MRSVLFICTANRCRSPMAMAFLQGKVAGMAQSDDWVIESAGTWAEAGYPVLDGALIVMAEKGLDLSSHWSRPITRELMHGFQLILTMEKGQKEALRVEFPEAADKVYLLSEMAGFTAEISDPVGSPLPAFREAANEIQSLIEKGFDRIVLLAG